MKLYRYSLNQWMNIVEETFEVKGINKYYSYYNSGYEIKTNVMIAELNLIHSKSYLFFKRLNEDQRLKLKKLLLDDKKLFVRGFRF